jgi:hypothetical protein
MIPVETIKQAMKLIADYVGITFIRAEQDGDRPALPFMEYKINSQGDDAAHLDTVTNSDHPTDPTRIIVTSERDDRATISLTFFGKDYSDIWAYAELAKDYLESERGKEDIYELGIFPRITSPEVNDRTSYLETSYEHRVGFDIAFEGIKVMTEETPAVDLEATVADLSL